MNIDLLQCKRDAQDLVASSDAPRNRNGRKKGYIEVMAELWEAKGYAHLGIKSQDLRDQASRIEKLDANDSVSNVQVNGLDTDPENLLSRIFLIILRVKRQQNQNANETTLDTDLHTAQGLLNHNSLRRLHLQSKSITQLAKMRQSKCRDACQNIKR